jgi:hypothetical protein
MKNIIVFEGFNDINSEGKTKWDFDSHPIFGYNESNISELNYRYTHFFSVYIGSYFQVFSIIFSKLFNLNK